jgi:hypothetical protein
MGNCCKKKTEEGGAGGRKNLNAEGGYTKIADGQQSASIKVGSVGTMISVQDGENGRILESTPNPNFVPSILPNAMDPECVGIINQLRLDEVLNSVKEKAAKINRDDLKKISDDKDTFTLYFDVKTDEQKEKYHTTVMETTYDKLAPLAYKLANSLIPEETELKLSSSYEKFTTIFRAKIGDVYYIMNYALYKKILLFNKKDMLFLKAFKELEGGDVAEVTVSVQHSGHPEVKGTDRMKIIDNFVYYKKSGDNSVKSTSFSSLYPRVGGTFGMLSTIFAKSYRAFVKASSEYLDTIKSSPKELEEDFKQFVTIPKTA